MHSRMGWFFFKNVSENLALQLFQSRFRRFDQANATRFLCQRSIVIMTKALAIIFIAEALQICKPVKFRRLRLTLRELFCVERSVRSCDEI